MKNMEKTKEVRHIERQEPLQRHPCLLFLSGHQAGLLWPLDESAEAITIGRSEEADIQIDAPEISRIHAHITYEGDQLWLFEDLGSTNGCFINNIRTDRQYLRANDKIQLGPYLTLKFMYQDDEEIAHYKQLYNRSIRDALTGVANRRHFYECLEQEWSFSKRHDLPLSVAILDIDHFKRVNDTYGHAAGDEVLKEFVRRILGEIRKEDLLARHGGEEFALLLRHTNLLGSLALTERIRQTIAGTPFPTTQGNIPVTVSTGLMTYERAQLERHQPEDLVNEADAYLYQAKNSGRNCVCGPPLEGD